MRRIRPIGHPHSTSSSAPAPARRRRPPRSQSAKGRALGGQHAQAVGAALRRAQLLLRTPAGQAALAARLACSTAHLERLRPSSMARSGAALPAETPASPAPPSLGTLPPGASVAPAPRRPSLPVRFWTSQPAARPGWGPLRAARSGPLGDPGIAALFARRDDDSPQGTPATPGGNTPIPSGAGTPTRRAGTLPPIRQLSWPQPAVVQAPPPLARVASQAAVFVDLDAPWATLLECWTLEPTSTLVPRRPRLSLGEAAMLLTGWPPARR